jgi:hypothetical protein
VGDKEQQLKTPKKAPMKPRLTTDADGNDFIPHDEKNSLPFLAPISPCSVSCTDEARRPHLSSSRHGHTAREQHESNPSPSLEIPILDAASESSLLSYIFDMASPTDNFSYIPPTSPGESLGFSKEFAKAFSDGTLLPYIISLLSSPPSHLSIQDAQKTTWNGHLPLDPYDAHANEGTRVEWRMPRRRRIQQQQQHSKRDASPHFIFPTTLSDPNQVEIYFHSYSLVCFFAFCILTAFIQQTTHFFTFLYLLTRFLSILFV